MLKILIIEDEERNMKLANDILSGRGYEILQADNAELGLEIAKEKLPNLILMDIQMPGMDGLEATRQLKADPNLNKIHIIALSAMGMVGDEKKIRLAGANDYLMKPYRYKDLIDKIEKFEKNHQM